MEISVKARKAVLLASLCSVSYLAVYIARNLLGAVTPQIIESGVFDESFIGSLSSLYFVCYAVGQLINGAIGDKIKAKYMICFGLFLAGVTNFIFPHLTAYPYAVLAIYACTGFFLSMIYGPMSKIVSENVDPLYAPRCSLGYTFASFFGSPSAGALAAILSWSAAFTASSVMLALMAAVGFICFTLLEKRESSATDNTSPPPAVSKT